MFFHFTFQLQSYFSESHSAPHELYHGVTVPCNTPGICFEPFLDTGVCSLGPWLPHSLHHDGTYARWRKHYGDLLAPDSKGLALEPLANNFLKRLVLVSKIRPDGNLGASDVWDNSIGLTVGMETYVQIMVYYWTTFFCQWQTPPLALLGTPNSLQLGTPFSNNG